WSELLRKNMPAGPVDPSTFATSNLETNENSFVQFGFYANALVAGSNVLAVEVHQHSLGLSDCSFDLELTGSSSYVHPSIVITNPVDRVVLGTNDLLIEPLV